MLSNVALTLSFISNNLMFEWLIVTAILSDLVFYVFKNTKILGSTFNWYLADKIC